MIKQKGPVIESNLAWAKRVRCALIERDMTMKELAKELGYTDVYVSRIICCKIGSQAAMNKISAYLNIPNC